MSARLPYPELIGVRLSDSSSEELERRKKVFTKLVTESIILAEESKLNKKKERKRE